MTRRTDNNGQTPRRRWRGNLKPAPFFLTPETVRGIIALTEHMRPRVVAVPVLPVKLVDRPRRYADPRLAKANDDGKKELMAAVAAMRDAELPVFTSAKIEFIDAPAPIDPAPCDKIAEQTPAPADVVETGQLDIDWPDAPLPEPTAPVEVRVCRGETPRIEIIRAAVEAMRNRAEHNPRATIGKPEPKSQITIPPLPISIRKARFAAAEAFLKARCILVTPVDRHAMLRKYLVSGQRQTMLAEDVIEHAIALGMTRDALTGDLA